MTDKNVTSNKSVVLQYITYLMLPCGIIILNTFIALFFKGILGKWMWIPLALSYWSSCFVTVLIYAKKNKIDILKWFGITGGKIRYKLIALVVGLIPMPILILQYRLLNTNLLIALWMAFAVINPFFEETFWRGFMISFNDRIGATFKIISSSLLFTASHPMMWGVFSYGSRSYVALISIFIMGLAWAFTFHKSKNLFWQYISHVMVDIFNVSVLVLMNIYVP